MEGDGDILAAHKYLRNARRQTADRVDNWNAGSCEGRVITSDPRGPDDHGNREEGERDG